MPFALDLLLQRDAMRARAREELRLRVRERLRDALSDLLPGTPVLIAGSVTMAGRFHERSDVDVALEALPDGWSPYALAAELEMRVGRPVDLIELPTCRFADKLRREGEWWTP